MHTGDTKKKKCHTKIVFYQKVIRNREQLTVQNAKK